MSKNKKTKIAIKNPKRILIILTIIIMLMLLLVIKNNKIKEKTELSIIINNEDVTHTLENEIVIKDDVQYLSFEDIKKCLDKNIYMEDDIIILSSDKKIGVLNFENNQIEINGSKVNIKSKPYKNEGGVIYIPISELQSVYEMEYTYIPEHKNIIIDNYYKKLEKAYLKKNQFILKEKKSSADKLEKIAKGNWVIYVSEEDGWAKVRSQNGNLGYVKMNSLTNFVTQRDALENVSAELDDNATFQKDISKKNIQKYENRKTIIEELLLDAITNKKSCVKIIYNKDKQSNEYKRFILEATAILKESGITIIEE